MRGVLIALCTAALACYGQSEHRTFYFAMEFLKGITLEELVEQHGPVPPARAVYILARTPA